MAPRIRVSPVVVFSILDHYVRRNENQVPPLPATPPPFK